MYGVKMLMVLVLLSLNFCVNAESGVDIIKPVIEVYRSPKCSCCSRWIEHLKENQWIVADYITNDVQPIKEQHAVPNKMASCHTALVNGYVIEGHVPSADIKKLLKLKPEVIGISVPGMPIGTPGMEMGNKKDAYEVISFDKENNYRALSRYAGN